MEMKFTDVTEIILMTDVRLSRICGLIELQLKYGLLSKKKAKNYLKMISEIREMRVGEIIKKYR